MTYQKDIQAYYAKHEEKMYHLEKYTNQLKIAKWALVLVALPILRVTGYLYLHPNQTSEYFGPMYWPFFFLVWVYCIGKDFKGYWVNLYLFFKADDISEIELEVMSEEKFEEYLEEDASRTELFFTKEAIVCETRLGDLKRSLGLLFILAIIYQYKGATLMYMAHPKSIWSYPLSFVVVIMMLVIYAFFINCHWKASK